MRAAAVARWIRASLRIVMVSVVWLPGAPLCAQPTFDHAEWDGVLRRYVADGLVD